MIIKYELNKEDLIRILSEHYNVPEENVKLDVHIIETGWEMAPVTTYSPYAIIEAKQK